MKCIICGRDLDSNIVDGMPTTNICEECVDSRDELTNGKEDE